MEAKAGRRQLAAFVLTIQVVWGYIALDGPFASTLGDQGEEGHYQDGLVPDAFTDWTRGQIVARGVAVLGKTSANQAQSLEGMRAAAWVAARRNLLIAVNRIYVDAFTTVGGYLATDPDLRLKVEALVRKAGSVQERALPDGSFEVIVAMDLIGELSGLIFPVPGSNVYTRFADY